MLTEDEIDNLPLMPSSAGGSFLDAAEGPYDNLYAALVSLVGQRVLDSIDETMFAVNMDGTTKQQQKSFLVNFVKILKASKKRADDAVKRGKPVLERIFHLIPTWGEKQLTAINGTGANGAGRGPNGNISVEDVMLYAKLLGGTLGIDLSMLGFSELLSGGLGDGGFFRTSAQAAERSRLLRVGLTEFYNTIIDVHASIPMIVGDARARNSSSRSRVNRFRNTGLPLASSPTTWNTDFPISMPMRAIAVEHNPIHALDVDARRTGLFPTTAQQRPDTPIAVGRQVRHMPLNFLDQPGIISHAGTATVAPVRRANPLHHHGRARHAEDFADRLHRSSPGSKGERAIRFFDRPQSTASFRISTSSVFFPSSRCSSLISLMAAASSDAGTTDSPAFTAARLPSWYCLRQPNTWLVLTPCRRATADTEAPGSSVSCTMAIFSCAVRRRRRSGSVRISMLST